MLRLIEKLKKVKDFRKPSEKRYPPILVLELTGDTYRQIGNFTNDDLVKSPGFSELNLKVSEVFNQEN